MKKEGRVSRGVAGFLPQSDLLFSSAQARMLSLLLGDSFNLIACVVRSDSDEIDLAT